MTLADGGVVAVWTEVTAVDGDVVAFVHHNRFDDGTVLTSEASIRFRPEADVRVALADAGFAITALYGGFGREPVGAGELLFVATAV